MRGALLLSIVIATNIAPSRGQIGANYFDGLNESQVWINLEPQNLESGPNPIELNVTVSFPGRTLPTAPSSVNLRLQAYCQLYPLRVRQPALKILADGAELRFGQGGRPLQVSSACSDEGQTTDVVTAQIPFAVLRHIATARVVDIHALGFDTRLAAPGLRALESFIAAVENGVSVK